MREMLLNPILISPVIRLAEINLVHRWGIGLWIDLSGYMFTRHSGQGTSDTP